MDSINNPESLLLPSVTAEIHTKIFSFIYLLVNLSHVKNEVSLLVPILQIQQEKEKGDCLALAPYCMGSCTEVEPYFVSL